MYDFKIQPEIFDGRMSPKQELCLYQKIGNISWFSRKMFRKINASKD